MPRASNGTYTLPSGYQATPGTTILSASQHNDLFTDLQTTLNADFNVIGYHKSFATGALLTADTTMTYSTVQVGQYVFVVEGDYIYKVAASGATDENITTAGGVKLYSIPRPDHLLTRAEAEGLVDTSGITVLAVYHGGLICYYEKDASGTALTSASAQNWSPLGGVCTPAHWGALPGVSTDYGTELDALSDHVKGSYNASAGVYEAYVDFARQVWRSDSGFRMISARSGGMLIENGALWVTGSTSIGMDLTDCHTVTVRDVEVIGDTATPPAVGFLLSRSGDQSLRASPRHTLINCSTTGEFTKCGRLRIASEVSVEVGCSWSNESKLLTAYADACVDHAGALDDHMGGVTSPNATLPVAADGQMSNTVHDDGNSKSIRRAKVNLTVTAVTRANPAVVTVSTGTLAGAGVSNGDKVVFSLVAGMTELEGVVHTVANINTGADTFELSGIDSTAYTAFTSGTVQNQTGRHSLYAGSYQYRREAFYSLVYGSPAVTVDFDNGGPIRDFRMEMHAERDPFTAFEFYLGSSARTLKGFNFRLLNASQTVHDEVVQINGSATLNVDSGGIYINNMGTAPANGIWDTPAQVNISGGFVEDVPIEAALNDTSTFASYKGLRVAHDSSWQVQDYREAEFYGDPELNGEAFATLATYASADFNSAAHAVNTTNKRGGAIRFNSDTSLPVYASGPGATATWKLLSDNSVAHSPS